MKKLFRLLKCSDCIMITATSVVLVFVTRAMPNWVNSWMLLQWNITYETGFICRGLMGSFIHLFFNPLITNDLIVVGAANLLLYIAALNIFLIWIYKNNKSMGMFVFIIFFLSSPFVTQWYFTSVMFRRLDVILNIAFIVSIIIILKSKNKVAFTYMILTAVSSICLLIHDGFAVYSVPTIFGIMMLAAYHKGEKWRLWHPMAYYILPIAVLYCGILYFGRPNLPLEDYHSLLCSKTGEVAIKLTNVKSVFYMGLNERVEYTLSMLSVRKIAELIGTLVFLAPTIAAISYLWVSIFKFAKSKRHRALVLLILLGSLSTSIAFFLAVDTMRWLGYIMFNNLFALGSFMMMDKSYAQMLSEKLEEIKYVLIFAAVLAVVLGPTQWMNGFYAVGKILSVLGIY